MEMVTLSNISKQFANGYTAVNQVSFSIQQDEILALVGESGSGKSTLAEILIGLQSPTSGSITWHNQALNDTVTGKQRSAPQHVQLVFQNPDRSLHPYWRVKDIIMEPLLLRKVARAEALQRAAELLEQVKLPASLLERRPGECSGGQKQRIAIARALTTSPALLIADEITSSLDPVTENDILNLLLLLKRQYHMSILYITHRLETVAEIADRVAVMKAGNLLEIGKTEHILRSPQSSYTKALLNACLYSAQA